MNYLTTTATVLRRINYGEADRIITVLTKDKGKIGLIAKGVRKSTSKLAGGIELFSESQIQFIKGKGDIHTLTSARIVKNYSKISQDLNVSKTAYEIIALIDKITEHYVDSSYYPLLIEAMSLLDNQTKLGLVLGNFYAKVLANSGHHLNFNSDVGGNELLEKENYHYNFEKGGFELSKYGLSGSTVKVTKLLFTHSPIALNNVTGMEHDLSKAISLLRSISEYYLNIKSSV